MDGNVSHLAIRYRVTDAYRQTSIGRYTPDGRRASAPRGNHTGCPSGALGRP